MFMDRIGHYSVLGEDGAWSLELFSFQLATSICTDSRPAITGYTQLVMSCSLMPLAGWIPRGQMGVSRFYPGSGLVFQSGRVLLLVKVVAPGLVRVGHSQSLGIGDAPWMNRGILFVHRGQHFPGGCPLAYDFWIIKLLRS